MIVHTIQKDEYLSKIAKDYGLPSWKTIYNHRSNANYRRRRPDPDKVHVGDRINIPITLTIKPAANQQGKTGDLVPSTMAAGGKKHFVSPKKNVRTFADYVILESSHATGFGAQFKWEGAIAEYSAPHKARVPRNATGRHHVMIKNRATGKVVDEMIVWIVWCTITAKDARNMTGDKGTFFLTKMGYEFTHAIAPKKIITDADRPNLAGNKVTSPPTAGALNYEGKSLNGGSKKKWDSSRQIRAKTLNPKNVVLPGDASFHGNFPKFPNAKDGDGRPGGAGVTRARDVFLVGNDDAGTGDEDNNPYTAPHVGELWGIDRPARSLAHTAGADGNTVEWRLHFKEFARLEINRKWYLISDEFPWRVHLKMKKVSGKWTNNGSNKAKNNAGF